MELNTLKSFYAVISEGGFSRAAHKLFLTQPAVTFHIQSLEKELSEPLFDRNSKTLALTEAGKILKKHCEPIFDMLDNVKNEIGAVKNLVQGSLSVGCSDTLSAYLLPALISPFWKKYPKLDITVKNAPTARIIELVMQKNADIGIVSMPVSRTDLISHPLLTYRDIAVFSPAAFSASMLTLADLAKQRLLLLEPGTRQRSLLDAEFQNASLNPESIMSFGSVAVQKAFAVAGIGAAVVPDFAARAEIKRGELRAAKIKGVGERQAGIIVSKKKQLSPAARALLAELMRWAEKEGRLKPF